MAINRFLNFVPVVCTLGLSACTSTPAVTSADLVGTWRLNSIWTRVNNPQLRRSGLRASEISIPQPVYFRFYPDGTTVGWPLPKGIKLHRDKYRIVNGNLVTENAGRSTRAKISLRGSELRYGNSRGQILVMRRVSPVEPGRLENGYPAGNLPESLRSRSTSNSPPPE